MTPKITGFQQIGMLIMWITFDEKSCKLPYSAWFFQIQAKFSTFLSFLTKNSFFRRRNYIFPLFDKFAVKNQGKLFVVKIISALVFVTFLLRKYYEAFYLFLLLPVFFLSVDADLARPLPWDLPLDIFSASRRIRSASSPKMRSNFLLFFLPRDATVLIP